MSCRVDWAVQLETEAFASDSSLGSCDLPEFCRLCRQCHCLDHIRIALSASARRLSLAKLRETAPMSSLAIETTASTSTKTLTRANCLSLCEELQSIWRKMKFGWLFSIALLCELQTHPQPISTTHLNESAGSFHWAAFGLIEWSASWLC